MIKKWPSSHTQNMDIVLPLISVESMRMYSLETAFNGACCATETQWGECVYFIDNVNDVNIFKHSDQCSNVLKIHSWGENSSERTVPIQGPCVWFIKESDACSRDRPTDNWINYIYSIKVFSLSHTENNCAYCNNDIICICFFRFWTTGNTTSQKLHRTGWWS